MRLPLNSPSQVTRGRPRENAMAAALICMHAQSRVLRRSELYLLANACRTGGVIVGLHAEKGGEEVAWEGLIERESGLHGPQKSWHAIC